MSRIFGIDLGTTNSLIAVMDNDRPQIIADRASANPLLPSVVAITPQGEVFVGNPAIAMEPHLTVERDGRIHAIGLEGGESGAVVRSVKRYMGLGGGEVAEEDRHRYSFADFSGAVVRFAVGERTLTPAQISGEILRALKARGHVVVDCLPPTSANSILATPDGFVGAADPRSRGGLAAGY